MADKCPYCYRTLGTHSHDPIFLPNGAKYKWNTDTWLMEVSLLKDRIYKGTTQLIKDDIIELQDELEIIEIDSGVSPLTVFSSFNLTGKFQITGKHIKEMRDSIEKILVARDLTKTNYFNYDEEGNHILHPNGDKLEWTDPITLATDLKKFQVKYIHIEDLRHYIQNIYFREDWENATIYKWYTPNIAGVLGQDAKSWLGFFNDALGSGSFIEITSAKDLYLYAYPNLLFGAMNSPELKYENTSSPFKLRQNNKLYFDVNYIDIPNKVTYDDPPNPPPYTAINPHSYNCFSIKIKAWTIASPIQEYIITYYFNYDPTYFINLTDLTGEFEGNLSVGPQIYNIYNDLSNKYSTFANYYNGVTDIRGCRIKFFNFELVGAIEGILNEEGELVQINSYPSEIKIDNIAIKT